MFLKRLDLVGFKSFAPRTTTELLPGISVVVGPNGSGKSNIADAVRWVLGEQSAKAVRARKPEEVIFAGSAMRQPLGMAEVSLILDNAEASLPIEYGEVRVTRRLYRSGDSEYLLNGARVRLKDITQLLLHAGISADGYAVIGQGSVDELILQRPDERRIAFENAADIRRHQLRLNDTRGKLTSTEANLVRVQDILAELAPHVRRLKTQADRAARAEAFGSELRSLLVRWFRERLRRARAAQQRAEAELSRAADIAREAEAAAQHAEESVRSSDAALQALDEQLAVLRPRADGFREQVRAAERALAVTRERAAGLRAQQANVLAERDQLVERVARLTGEEAEAALGAEPEPATSDEFESVRARVEQLERALAAVQTERSAAATELAAAEEEQRRAEAQLAHTQDQLRSLEAHAAVDQARRADREQRTRVLSQRLADLSAERTALDERLIEARAALQSAVEQHRVAAGEVDSCVEALRAARQQADRLQGALNALGATTDDREKGSDELLSALDGLPVVGVAGELAGRVRAVDQVVRGYLDRVVVLADDTVARQAYARLSRTEASDAPAWAVLSMTGLFVAATGERVLEAANGAARSALVDWQQEVQQTERALSAAQAASTECNTRLERAREALHGADSEERRHRAGLSELDAQRAQLERTERTLAQELHQLTSEAQRAEQAAERQSRSRADAAARAEVLSEAVAAVRTRRAGAHEALRAADERLAHAAAELNAAHTELASAEAVVLRRRAQYEARQALHARIADDLSAARSAEQSATSRLQQFTEQLDELTRREAQLVSEIESTLQQLAPMEEELARAEQRRAHVAGQRRSVEEQLAQLRSRERTTHAEREQRHVDAQRASDDLERLHVEIAETAELEGDDALVEQLRLEFPDTTEAESEGMDLDAVHRRIGVLQRELRAVGGVADSVVTEYRELRERHDFLEHQSQDLRIAMAELQQAASELEAHMRDRFESVFRAVDEAFVECFKVLFGGGEARLVLTQPEDLLSSGIDIVARPPGKKLQGLLSLSGGERALTVVALLFGLLKVNPTPFCVLDEVDAALDEANVQRFANLLAEFSERIQFIVVTHNRATMEKADAMYGVSMDANGISHVFTVQPRVAIAAT